MCHYMSITITDGLTCRGHRPGPRFGAARAAQGWYSWTVIPFVFSNYSYNIYIYIYLYIYMKCYI